MKHAIILILTVALVGLLPAATPLEIAKVNTDKLTEDTQQSTPGNDKGMNLSWWIPLEFWQAVFAQQEGVPDGATKEILASFENYFLVAVVRADISEMGVFRFHNEAAVRRSMKVWWVDAAGTRTEIKPVTEVSTELESVLGAMRPVLTGAMGQMGRNFHFFVYSAKDAKGKRLADPKARGKLLVEMTKLGTDIGGTLEYATPLNSLFEPRVCKDCAKEMHITWGFCPWCGKKLPE